MFHIVGLASGLQFGLCVNWHNGSSSYIRGLGYTYPAQTRQLQKIKVLYLVCDQDMGAKVICLVCDQDTWQKEWLAN